MAIPDNTEVINIPRQKINIPRQKIDALIAFLQATCEGPQEAFGIITAAIYMIYYETSSCGNFTSIDELSAELAYCLKKYWESQRQ